VGTVRISTLTSLLITVFIALAGMNFVFSSQASQSDSKLDAAFEQRYHLILAVQDLQQASMDLTRWVRAYAVTGNPQEQADYWNEIFETRRRERAVETFEEFNAPQSELDMIRQALELSNTLARLEERAFSARGGGDIDGAIRLAFGDEYEAGRLPIMLTLSELSEIVEQRTQLYLNEARASAAFHGHAASVSVVLFAVISVVGVIIILLKVTPLAKLALSATQVARGNITADFHVNQNDEIGEVSLAFKEIVYTLNMLQEDFNKAAMNIQQGDLQFRINEAQFQGAFNAIVVEVNSIIARLETALEMEQAASRAKGVFFSNLSHEIRTPISAIIGMTEIAKKSADIDKKHLCLNKIERASKHLLGIINQILDMSKIEADKFECNLHSFNFASMVEDVVSILSLKIEEKGINFSVNLDKNIPQIIISDEVRLAQVLINLITNAIKFTPEDGTITLTAKLEKDTNLYVEVADTGMGISEEYQSRLFNAFDQTETGASREFGGTGLGLTVSKKIVDLMGGTIWYESQLGNGSIFMFTIPFETGLENNKDNKKISDLLQNPPQYAGCKILIAEDVEINREIILSILEPLLIETEIAVNGAQAVQMFTATPEAYNMILMDLQMPEMGGIDATRHIRELGTEKAKSIPIIAMTANVFQNDVDMCLANGMNDHIGKPFEIGIVMDKLMKWLNV